MTLTVEPPPRPSSDRRRPSGARWWVDVAAKAFVGIAAVAVIGWFAANTIWPDATAPQWLMSVAATWLVPVAPLVALTGVVLRRLPWTPVALVAAVILLAPMASHRWPNLAGPPEAHDVRVMTFNVFAANDQPGDVVAMIARYEPDVVALQEVSDTRGLVLMDELADAYPHQRLGDGTFGGTTAIISKTPLISVTEVDLDIDRPGLIATTEIDGQLISVASAHLYPSYYAWQASPAQVPGELGRFVDAQHRQVDLLLNAFDAQPADVPILFGCDCNTYVTNQTYDLLDDEFTDSSRQLGWRLRSSPLPGTNHEQRLKRVDYQWYRGEVRPVGVYRVYDTAGSDHHPLIADYVVGAN